MQSNHLAARRARTFLAPLTLSFALSALAAAEEPTPGSLLLFPEYEGIGSSGLTVITVTNVSPDEAVTTRWTYVDGQTCLSFSRTELLTPSDMLTVLVPAHHPNPSSGYLYVDAVDSGFRSIVFESLIGTSTRLDGIDSFDYTVDPIAFHGVGAAGQLTDLDEDGIRDLDGVEYSQVVDELFFPRFFGQSPVYQSELVMLNLSGGAGYTALVDVLVFNDNEEVFSAQHTFHCWGKTPLATISGVFDQSFLADLTNHDPDEIIGAPSIESGWFRLNGNGAFSVGGSIPDPAVLGVLVERSGTNRRGAELPFGIGSQSNGALLEFGSGGGKVPATPFVPER